MESIRINFNSSPKGIVFVLMLLFSFSFVSAIPDGVTIESTFNYNEDFGNGFWTNQLLSEFNLTNLPESGDDDIVNVNISQVELAHQTLLFSSGNEYYMSVYGTYPAVGAQVGTTNLTKDSLLFRNYNGDMNSQEFQMCYHTKISQCSGDNECYLDTNTDISFEYSVSLTDADVENLRAIPFGLFDSTEQGSNNVRQPVNSTLWINFVPIFGQSSTNSCALDSIDSGITYDSSLETFNTTVAHLLTQPCSTNYLSVDRLINKSFDSIVFCPRAECRDSNNDNDCDTPAQDNTDERIFDSISISNIAVVNNSNTLPKFQNITQDSQYICLDKNGNAEVNLTYDVYDGEGDSILYSSALTGKSRKYINFAEEFFIDVGDNCQENYNYLGNYIITNASVLITDEDRILYSLLDHVSIRESDCLGILDFDTNLQNVYLHFGKTFTYDTTTNVQFGVYNTEHEFYLSPYGSKGDLFDIFYNITSLGNLTIKVDGNLVYNKAKDSFIALDSVFYDLPLFNDINMRIVFDNDLNTTNVSFAIFDGGIENTLSTANILLNKSYSNFEGFSYKPQTINDDGISISNLLVTGSQLYTVPTFSSTKIEDYTFTTTGIRNLDIYISDLVHQPFNYTQTTFTFNILEYEDERCIDYTEKESSDILFALRGIFRPLMTSEIQDAFDSAIWIVWFFLMGWFIWTLRKITFSIGIATTISGTLAFLFASTPILISFIVLVPISWILAVGVRA